MSHLLVPLKRSSFAALPLCLAALAASLVFTDGALRPLASHIIGDPDAAVTGKPAVGTGGLLGLLTAPFLLLMVSRAPGQGKPTTALAPSLLWRALRVVGAEWQVLGVLITVLLLTYSSSLTIPYGFLDDYSGLLGAKLGTGSELAAGVALGRPIAGLLAETISRIPNPTIGWLQSLRLLCVLGMALLAFVFYLAIHSFGRSRDLSILSALALILLPPFQVHVAWASLYYTPLAGLAGAGAAYLAGVTQRAGSRGGRLGRAGLAVLLLVGGLMIYQPSAMIYWAFVGVVWLSSGQDLPRSIRLMIWAGGVMVCALVVELVSFRWLTAALTIQPNARAQLVTSPFDKLAWFVNEPLVNALNFIKLSPSPILAVALGIAITVGLWLHFRGSLASRLARLAIAVVLVLLAYLPSLIVAESWAAYRSLVALGALLLVYALFALLGYQRWIGTRLPRFARLVGNAVLIAFVGFSVFGASRNVTSYFAMPQAMEFGYLKSQLAESDLESATSVWIIRPNWSQGVSRFVRYDEFGVPSSYPIRPIVGMVYFALEDIDPAQSGLAVRSFAYDEDLPAIPPGTVVVDMRAQRYLR